MSNQLIKGELWEVYDQGSLNYLDLYTFDCVNSEYPEPAKKAEAETLVKLLKRLNIQQGKLVNRGVVQDEYADYLEQRT